MSVLFVANNPYSAARWAGMQWLAAAARRYDENVYYMAVVGHPLRFLRSWGALIENLSHFNEVRGFQRAKYGVWSARAAVMRRRTLGKQDAVGTQEMRDALFVASPGIGIVVYESGWPLLCFDSLSRMLPGARHVYRVSDSVPLFFRSKAVREAEQLVMREADLVSVPSTRLARELEPSGARIAVHHHGVPNEVLEANYTVRSPYSERGVNVVVMGGTLFDEEAVVNLSQALGESGMVHIFGPRTVGGHKNIRNYGSLPLDSIVPYLCHASAGVAPYRLRSGCEYIAESSNKILIYKAVGLPVIAPRWLGLPAAENHLIYDNADDASWENIKTFLMRDRYPQERRVRAGQGRDWLEVWRDIST